LKIVVAVLVLVLEEKPSTTTRTRTTTRVPLLSSTGSAFVDVLVEGS